MAGIAFVTDNDRFHVLSFPYKQVRCKVYILRWKRSFRGKISGCKLQILVLDAYLSYWSKQQELCPSMANFGWKETTKKVFICQCWLCFCFLLLIFWTWIVVFMHMALQISICYRINIYDKTYLLAWVSEYWHMGFLFLFIHYRHVWRAPQE